LPADQKKARDPKPVKDADSKSLLVLSLIDLINPGGASVSADPVDQ